MPIAVHAVPPEEFTAWVEQAKKAANATPSSDGAARLQTAAADAGTQVFASEPRANRPACSVPAYPVGYSVPAVRWAPREIDHVRHDARQRTWP